MTFSELRSLVGLAPKTLDQAKGTIDTAKGTLDSVNALFTAAGLSLETLLAAGSDSLKAHIAGLSAKDADLAAAIAKVTELEGKVTTATGEASALTTKFSALTTAIAPLGITATTKPEEFSALIDSHVKQAAALELAKTGHKPVADIPPPAPGKAAAIDPTLTGLARVEAAFKAARAAK